MPAPVVAHRPEEPREGRHLVVPRAAGDETVVEQDQRRTLSADFVPELAAGYFNGFGLQRKSKEKSDQEPTVEVSLVPGPATQDFSLGVGFYESITVTLAIGAPKVCRASSTW